MNTPVMVVVCLSMGITENAARCMIEHTGKGEDSIRNLLLTLSYMLVSLKKAIMYVKILCFLQYLSVEIRVFPRDFDGGTAIHIHIMIYEREIINYLSN